MKSFMLLGLVLFMLLPGCVREVEPIVEVTDEAMSAGETNPLIGTFLPYCYLYPTRPDSSCYYGTYKIDLDHDGRTDFEITSSRCTTNACVAEKVRLYITCSAYAQVMVESNTDRNIKTLVAGDDISSNQIWCAMYLEDLYKSISYMPPCGAGQLTDGNWQYVGRGYIGLRLCKSYPLYGWVKVSVDKGNITIEEIASQVLRK